MNKRLLEILCCPVSKTSLRRLRKDELAHLNQVINRGTVHTVEGEEVSTPLKDGLITEDKKVIYPIVDDIPVLLPESGIGTTQLTDLPD